MRPHSHAFVVLPLALAPFAACHGSTEVVVKDPHPIYAESEPNDDAFGADNFGFLHPGEHFGIAGDVRDDPNDPQDGFAFVAAESIVIDFTLQAECGCADLDLWVYDPVLDEFAGVFDTGGSSEQGSITVYGQEFHLIVVSASGDANYRLDLGAHSIYGATATGEAHAAAAVDGMAAARARLAERTPTAELKRYRAAARSTGAPRVVEIYTIDPELGVVARTRVLAGN